MGVERPTVLAANTPCQPVPRKGNRAAAGCLGRVKIPEVGAWPRDCVPSRWNMASPSFVSRTIWRAALLHMSVGAYVLLGCGGTVGGGGKSCSVGSPANLSTGSCSDAQFPFFGSAQECADGGGSFSLAECTRLCGDPFDRGANSVMWCGLSPGDGYPVAPGAPVTPWVLVCQYNPCGTGRRPEGLLPFAGRAGDGSVARLSQAWRTWRRLPLSHSCGSIASFPLTARRKGCVRAPAARRATRCDTRASSGNSPSARERACRRHASGTREFEVLTRSLSRTPSKAAFTRHSVRPSRWCSPSGRASAPAVTP